MDENLFVSRYYMINVVFETKEFDKYFALK